MSIERWQVARKKIAFAAIFVGFFSIFTLAHHSDYGKNLPIGIDTATTSLAGICFGLVLSLSLIIFGFSEIKSVEVYRLTNQEDRKFITDTPLENRNSFSIYWPWTAFLFPLLAFAVMGLFWKRFNGGAAVVYYSLFSPFLGILLAMAHKAEKLSSATKYSLWVTLLSLFIFARVLRLMW